MSERVVPHNLDAERSVLGACLLHQAAWAEVASMLHAEDFFRLPHRTIFQAMERLADQRVMIDFLTLKEELGDKALADIGGPVYLATLVDGLPHESNLKYHCGIVREKARQRDLITLGTALATSAYAEEETAAELAAQASSRLMQMTSVRDKDAVRVKAAVNAYMEALLADTALAPVLTHYADLDRLIGGLNRGELTIVAARPSVGKSSFALRAAKQMAAHGTPAAVFSLEMRCPALAAQIMAWESGIPNQKLRRKEATDAEYQRVSQAWLDMPDIPLFLYDVGHTLTEVVAWSQKLRDREGVQVVFVDYLQLLVTQGRRRSDSRQDEVAGISRALKALAMDQELAVVALSQLTRAPEDRKDKRPHISDLRESGALEQDADVAILLFREWMHKRTEETRGVAEVIVAKNRMGPVGTEKLYFHDDLALFGNLTRGERA